MGDHRILLPASFQFYNSCCPTQPTLLAADIIELNVFSSHFQNISAPEPLMFSSLLLLVHVWQFQYPMADLPIPWPLSSLIFFFFPVFLGPYTWHIEVPRLGIESEL